MDVEPVFETAEPERSEQPMPPAASPKSAAASVDDQLSDLLTDLTPANEEAVAPVAALATEISATPPGPAIDFAAKLIGRSRPAAPIPEAGAEPQHRPGFTVSRDGYVPGQAADTGHIDEARNPFDFDLGPSPFETRVAAPAAMPVDLTKTLVEAPLAEVAVPEVVAAVEAVATPAASEVTVAPAAPVTSTGLALPSQSDAAPPAALALNELAAPSAQDRLTPVAEPMGATQNEAAAASAQQLSPAIQRTMEDTVADLLRPMLKTWLAENMPKIVERALRREISDRSLIEHKAAAE